MSQRTRESLEQFRSEVVPRLHNAVAATEKGVLDTGAKLTKIVDHTRDQGDELKSLLPLVESSEDQRGIDETFHTQSRLVEDFVEEILRELRAQGSIASEAASMTDSIMRLAGSIGEIARNSQILTINAKIEAIRLGERGNAIKVIAEELSAVSRSVAKANEAVAETAARLTEILPALAGFARSVQGTTETFASGFTGQQGETRMRLDELREKLRIALERSEARTGEVLELSRGALVSLQFQDPIAQDLGDAEAAIFDLAERLGVTLDAPAPERRLRASGEGADDDARAGDVVMF